MTLLIDIGNTRIKWNARDALDTNEQHAAVYANWTSDQLRRQMLDSLSPSASVLVANVGGAAIGELLSATLLQAWNVTPVFVRSQAVAAGIINAYSEPEKLGVDRWLAIIAAHRLVKSSVCVVSIGTATTVDGVASDGRHLGGMIIPGPDLMIGSLLKNTADIAARATNDVENSHLFANNTLGAIRQGATLATVATVERAYHDMHARYNKPPVLVLTGGGIARIQSLLQVPYRIVPDLVLRGLAAISHEFNF